jgi:hypothetical protein
MSPVIAAEVHFHQQDQASVFSQSNIADSWNERLAEIGLFSFYSLRMFSNLGVNETSDALASMMLDPEEAIENISVVAYPGHPGRYSFLSTLTFGEGFQFLLPMAGQARFDFKPKGFGFLARGVGYYGPTSVLVLLRYLAEKRDSDQVYLEALAEMASFLGQWHLARKIGLGNQNQLGLLAMSAATKPLRRKAVAPEELPVEEASNQKASDSPQLLAGRAFSSKSEILRAVALGELPVEEASKLLADVERDERGA